jgi:hypothetical protein
MGQPTEDEVFHRAKQLFEEENGRPWKTSFSKHTGDTPAEDPGEDEAAKYIERARVELSAIEEEGHS